VRDEREPLPAGRRAFTEDPLKIESTGIIGTGLIGGSLALAMRKYGWPGEIAGFDEDTESLKEALRSKALDRTATSAAELARQADLLVLAVPVRAIAPLLEYVAPFLREGALVIDVGSTKSGIMRAAEKTMPPHATFVGGHPMAGSERRGFAHADPDLFRGAAFIFTPPRECAPEVYSFLSQAFTGLGARVLFMDAETHDRAVAVVSHLPHVLAFALVNLVLEESGDAQAMTNIVSGGFRDMTRIAASDASLWADILLENRTEVERALTCYLALLEEIRVLVRSEDAAALMDQMKRARSGRLGMVPALGESMEDLYAVIVPVENRPGMISSITRALGELGVNLEDLEITHPLEGGSGLLRLYVRGEEIAAKSRRVLAERGYDAVAERVMAT